MQGSMKGFFVAAVAFLWHIASFAKSVIVSPADYETISAMSPFLKSFKETAAMVDWRTYRVHDTPARATYDQDRTGTLGYILLGVLGVPRRDLDIDWAMSWYSYNDDAFVLKSSEIDQTYRFLQKKYAGRTLAEKCEAYLLRCASDAGIGPADAADLIVRYKRIMLEEPESPVKPPARPARSFATNIDK